jgi:two-component system, cell cycle sensor histidine kinase DivJ
LIQDLLTLWAKTCAMTKKSILFKQTRRISMRALGMPFLWVGGVLVCTVLAVFLSTPLVRPVILTLALIGCVPAFISLLLSPFLEEDWARALIVLSWTGLAGLAVASAGGLSTPFVVLFIMPIVAAHSLGGPRLTMEATALGMFAVALLVAMGTGGMLPTGLLQADVLPLVGPFSIILTLIAGASALVIQRQGGWDAHSARLRLMRFSLDPVVCMDARGRNLAASPEARRIMGGARRLGSVLGAAHRARFDTAATRVLRSGKSEDVEVEIVDRQQNKTHRYELRLARDHEKALMISLHDITLRSAREERLIAERDAALGVARERSQFLAGISHELRTPLNAIIGFSDMMKARLFGPLPAKYAEYADLIYDSGRHLVDLVGDVLDMSKIEANHYVLNKTGFDARDVVSSSIKLMELAADEAGVHLTSALPNGVVPVNADRKAMRQMLFNLLSNAIKFTPAGGTIKVKLSTQGQDVLLAVSDDGVGMSSEDAAKVGQPYQQAASAQTTNARGTGLGMALVKSLAGLHKGSMSVQSELGTGTTVCIRMPVLDASAMGLGEVAKLDVRSHIRRAQNASDEIAQIAQKIAKG